jgi:hypothetical protein
MALSVGFIRFVSSTDATRATGLLTLTLVGLIPTEHVCLVWTHCLLKKAVRVWPLLLRLPIEVLLRDNVGDLLAAFDLVEGVNDLFVATAFARHRLRLLGRPRRPR